MRTALRQASNTPPPLANPLPFPIGDRAQDGLIGGDVKQMRPGNECWIYAPPRTGVGTIDAPWLHLKLKAHPRADRSYQALHEVALRKALGTEVLKACAPRLKEDTSHGAHLHASLPIKMHLYGLCCHRAFNKQFTHRGTVNAHTVNQSFMCFCTTFDMRYCVAHRTESR